MRGIIKERVLRKKEKRVEGRERSGSDDRGKKICKQKRLKNETVRRNMEERIKGRKYGYRKVGQRG